MKRKEVSYKKPLGVLLKKSFPNVNFEWDDDSASYITTDNEFVSKYSRVYVNSVDNSIAKLKNKIRSSFKPKNLSDYHFESQLRNLIINDDFEWIMVTID